MYAGIPAFFLGLPTSLELLAQKLKISKNFLLTAKSKTANAFNQCSCKPV